MARDHIDLITITSDESSDSDAVNQTPQRQRQSHSVSQPASHPHRPISPPVLNRQPTQPTASVYAESPSIPMAAGSPSRSCRGSAQKPLREDTKTTALPVRAGSAINASLSTTSPLHSNPLQPNHKTPKHHTPKKVDWTVKMIEEKLFKLSQDIGKDGARLTARQIQMAWKKDAPSSSFISKKNWLAELQRPPADTTKSAMKIKTKQVGPGRAGKQEKRESYQVTIITTPTEPVPSYSFHHVEISKNILSPNTMLSFVPHLRDLQDEDEPKYRRWLENLEDMDKTSGFATLSRQEKVIKTVQKERATILLLYLDTWLDQLSIENCTRPTLIRHMASQTDAVTPQQKSSILNSYNDDSGSPRSAKAVRMFTQAFDRVFNPPPTKNEEKDKDKVSDKVSLRDVLLLDKSVDTIVDSKKWMKETPSQVKPAEEHATVESFLETYALLGCLICSSHSCEHGEYGVDNERKRFSIEVVGGLEPMLRNTTMQATNEKVGDSPVARRPRKACSEDCYSNGKSNTRARAWSETETMILRSFVATLSDTKIPVQCATAVATGRPCWDVNRQLEKLDINLPVSSPPPPAVKIKSVTWYDRNKKMLLGDWQDQTHTHEHQRKEYFDPCSHEGPCTYSNCSCVRAHVMCERFCRCTAATCAVKFTGCACHSLGKTCVSKQKERPCICVQLNRECDPTLCGSCGASERANPRNADDDAIFATGCQNCPLQRGKPKSLILGKSMIKNCGYGLFTAEDIAQDEFVIEYVGELISQDEGVRREARRGDVFDEESNSSYLFTLLEQEGIWVDAAIYGNLSRYINHQDDADKRGLGCNITPKILYVGGEYRIKFTSMRDIKAGEELFFNYGENFPNLTKKLLDEQKKEKEEKVKKGKSRKKSAATDEGGDDEESDEPKQPVGAPKGKKRGRKPGRKPKKKAFAKIDSDPEDEEDVTTEDAPEDPFPDLLPRPRKRKRGALDSDSEDEEFRPDFVADSDAQSVVIEQPAVRSKSRSRKKLGNAGGKATRKSGGLFSRAVSRAQSDIQEEIEPTSTTTTPKRRGRKARKNVEEPAKEDIEAEDEVMVVNSEAQGAHDSDSAGDEETPSRVRTRRSFQREAIESSPLSAAPDEAAFESMRFALIDDDDDEERGRSRGDGEDDSDGSSNRIIDRSRSRVRRRPARYSD